MMNENLKPCPFCGHSAVWMQCANPFEFRIECGRIGNCAGNVTTERTGFTFKSDALRLWNTRSYEPILTRARAAFGPTITILRGQKFDVAAGKCEKSVAEINAHLQEGDQK